VFKWASLHVDGKDRQIFLDGARRFFDYSVNTLSSMPTRTLARPVILMLVHGWWTPRLAPEIADGERRLPVGGFGAPAPFVPQKVRAMRRAILGLACLAAAAIVSVILVIVYFFLGS
jgi:hypothetical protein